MAPLAHSRFATLGPPRGRPLHVLTRSFLRLGKGSSPVETPKTTEIRGKKTGLKLVGQGSGESVLRIIGRS